MRNPICRLRNTWALIVSGWEDAWWSVTQTEPYASFLWGWAGLTGSGPHWHPGVQRHLLEMDAQSRAWLEGGCQGDPFI